MPLTDALTKHLKTPDLIRAAGYIGGEWLEHQCDLALRRRGESFGEVGGGAARDLLVQRGELAADRDATGGRALGQEGERGREAVGRFEGDERDTPAIGRVERLANRASGAREKADEREAV